MEVGQLTTRFAIILAGTISFATQSGSQEPNDPTKAVVWGQQSWDGMMVGFFNLKFDSATPAKEISTPGAVHTH